MKRKRAGNAGWLKDLISVLIFLLLFPYFAFSFQQQKAELTGQEQDDSEKRIMEMYEELSDLSYNGSYYVLWQEEGVVLRLPAEHFLVGALAASVSIEYDMEVLKAQAIILRSSLMDMFQKEGKEIALDGEKGSYWTDKKMQESWKEAYGLNLEKCLSAVTQTKGIYLTYGGVPVKGYYHGMSAGETRNACNFPEEKKPGYLRKTSCPENLSAEDYLTELKFRKENVGKLSDEEVDENGYVLSVCKDGNRIPGEKFREELGLVSSNFTWKEQGDYYVFLVKGQGHGFGMDQYYGNILAGKGMNYREIIHYFFADVVHQRME